VRIFRNGICQSCGCLACEWVFACADVPTVIHTAGRSRRLEVDLLPHVLADIPNEEISGGAIKAEAPGVAQAIGPDLGKTITFDKGIIRWNGVGLVAIYIDP